MEAFGIEDISADTVSRISKELDEKVEEFLNRPIEQPIIYLIVDAVYVKVRCHGRYVNQAVLLIAGVREDGIREILGVRIADGEDEGFGLSLFEDLKSRGLRGVQLVTSDGHKGIQKAVKVAFLGASWQMCTVHYSRAILRNVPRKFQKKVSELLKSALNGNEEELSGIAVELEQMGYCKAADTVELFMLDVANYRSFPKEHWRRIRTTNMVERVNAEIKRRTKVVGAFPSQSSLLRLVVSILIDINEDWITGYRYLNMSELVEQRLLKHDLILKSVQQLELLPISNS
jgi:transposase-like protein